jgi:hypothetical protein
MVYPTKERKTLTVTTRTKIAFWCYIAAMAGPGAWGVMYLLCNEFMPYHAVAVGMPWPEVPVPFKILIIALMKVAGGGWVTVAVAVFVLLLVPFRQGARWAYWAIPSLGLLHYADVCIAMAHVMTNTPATPPWGFTIAGIILLLIGAALSIPTRAKASGV